jgi:hypothetical protein
VNGTAVALGPRVGDRRSATRWATRGCGWHMGAASITASARTCWSTGHRGAPTRVRASHRPSRRGGTIVFVGLPPGDFPAPIFDIVPKGLTIRGSIVGIRQDMVEALGFYAPGLIKPTVTIAGPDDVNDVLTPHGTRPDRRPHRHRLPVLPIPSQPPPAAAPKLGISRPDGGNVRPWWPAHAPLTVWC